VGTFFADSKSDALESLVDTSTYNQGATGVFALGTGYPGASRLYTPLFTPVGNNTISVDLFQYNGGGTNYGPNISNVIPFSDVDTLQKVVMYTDPANQRYAIAVRNRIGTLNTNYGLTGDYSYSLANMMVIGYNSGYFGNFSGRIKRITYYPKRLTDAQLQVLTR
jgi:hypothetical protein